MTTTRDQLLDGLRRDIIGPQGAPDEVIASYPSDQYISGILYTPPYEPEGEDDEDADAADDPSDGPGEAISMTAMRRPNMMGVSFAMVGEAPVVKVAGSAARYHAKHMTEKGELIPAQDAKDTSHWQRDPVALEVELVVTDELTQHKADHGLKWWVRGLRTGQDGAGLPRWQVTVVLTNENRPDPGRFPAEQFTFFQVHFDVRAMAPARLVARRSTSSATDEDALSNAVIYRKAEEWAVGHVCSANWRREEDDVVVGTAWIPTTIVPATSADGHPYFRDESKKTTGTDDGAFDGKALAEAKSGGDLARHLRVVPDAYKRWLAEQQTRITSLEASGEVAPDVAARAAEHLAIATNDVLRRLEYGIQVLVEDDDARLAFQLAQEAMCIQRRWSAPARPRLLWRPFQLAFQLLTIAGIARPGADGIPSDDRLTMDLLWFPTGGGKTEAYLGLTAFTLFLRRIRAARSGQDAAGVAVIMRYTLRLLTVQQFERAARLVVACDLIRRKRTDLGKLLGKDLFAIGLWVGSGATANTLEDAQTAEEQQRARQLARCPACGQPDGLRWTITTKSFEVHCEHPGCDVENQPLGIWTIDEVIYRKRPALLIGTIDKFAQIVRKAETHALFEGIPPELIIQDELHLISGPLGTVAGVYEAAVDLICTRNGIPPKVIGSTATIRRAGDQVLQLFNRRVLQFPPPVLDVEDSCFAVVDTQAPGRLYVGVTTAGRSPKFILQATCGSLLEWAYELPVSDAERDPYWTLVAYFNSLRELGGALVMMQDDVQDSALTYSRLHNHPTSRALEDLPLELTSRVDQADIPSFLVQLEEAYPKQQHASVLATNMISVGVDIPRLGLMVVNGQPKGMAEYIQATSRVGRGNVAGLVVTVYNAGRPRDRSHYEAFRTWHQTLYREVEATSVTPFAPRARDRALHAAIVALARHKVSGMLQSPDLTAAARSQLEVLVDQLVARARNVDPDEELGVQQDANAFMDLWENRVGVERYWNDYNPPKSLLVSLESVATAKATRGDWRHAAVGTPNSMRNVEAETLFQMWERPMSTKPKDGATAKAGGSDA